MRARFPTELDKFASPLVWSWGLRHNRKWQKSSAVSGIFWVLNTALIYHLVERLGHGWQVNTVASLAWDVLTYAVNKLWVWKTNRASFKISYSKNFVAWAAFFALNGTLAWLLMGQADVSTLKARSILGALGLLANPLRFKINDELVFEDR